MPYLKNNFGLSTTLATIALVLGFTTNVAALGISPIFIIVPVIGGVIFLGVIAIIGYKFYQSQQVKKQFFAQMGYASDADYMAARERAILEGRPMPMIPNIHGQYQYPYNVTRAQAINSGQAIIVGPAVQPGYPGANYVGTSSGPYANPGTAPYNYNNSYNAPPQATSVPSRGSMITTL